MTIPQTISFIILLTVILFAFKKGNDTFSPGKAFAGVWAFCIFLTEFKFSGYQHQWSSYSWIVFLLGLVAFITGVFIVYVVFVNKPLFSINEIKDKSHDISEATLKKLFYSIVILFVLYIVSYSIEVIVRGNVPIFSARPDRARTEFALFGLHLFVNFQITIMLLNVEYIILAKKNKLEKKIVWVIFTSTFLTFALLLQRFNFFFGGLMILAFLYYASRVLTFRRVVMLSAIFFGFLATIQSIRFSRYVSQYMYVISKMRIPKEYAVITEPYMYITMNLENMARGVEQLENHTYSAQTFDWIYALAGLKHWMAEYFNIDHRDFLNSSYTTFPFHWYYYWDFGIIGVILFPLLTGIAIGSCYYMMRYTAELKWIILYAIGFSLIVISFFTNPLLLLNFVSNILVLWFIHHFFVNKKYS